MDLAVDALDCTRHSSNFHGLTMDEYERRRVGIHLFVIGYKRAGDSIANGTGEMDRAFALLEFIALLCP